MLQYVMFFFFSSFFCTTKLLISNFLFKFLIFLKRLHYNQYARCEICCQKLESVGHIFWECPLARNVWAICRGKIQKCPNDAREFFALFRMLVDQLPQLELDRWATISWALWNARNKYYFEHVQQHPRVILDGALSFLAEYRRLLAAMTNS